MIGRYQWKPHAHGFALLGGHISSDAQFIDGRWIAQVGSSNTRSSLGNSYDTAACAQADLMARSDATLAALLSDEAQAVLKKAGLL
ncbi:MAG: hypothetical protein ABI411_21505 [Tahibacter sp.]